MSHIHEERRDQEFHRKVEGLYKVVKFVLESDDPSVKDSLRYMPPLDIDPAVYQEVLMRIQFEQIKNKDVAGTHQPKKWNELADPKKKTA
jgi:hypothetical protein